MCSSKERIIPKNKDDRSYLLSRVCVTLQLCSARVSSSSSENSSSQSSNSSTPSSGSPSNVGGGPSLLTIVARCIRAAPVRLDAAVEAFVQILEPLENGIHETMIKRLSNLRTSRILHNRPNYWIKKMFFHRMLGIQKRFFAGKGLVFFVKEPMKYFFRANYCGV